MTRDEAANIITGAIADHDEGLAGAIDAHALVDRILALAPFADRVAGEAEPKTIAGLCDCCSSWFGDLEQNTESEWLCGPCRVEEPAPPAAVAEQTDGEA